MVHTSFACRKGYGSHKCVEYLNKMIIKEERRLKKSSFSNIGKSKGLKPSVDQLYHLKIDFSKYFFSVNHDFLKEKIRKCIQYKELLYCIDLIIDSYNSPNNYNKLLSKNKLILNPKKISFNLVSDGITFVGYRFINGKIWVGKRIKKSFLKFGDSLEELKKKNLKLSKNDILRLKSMYYSRLGCFKITDFGNNYVKNYLPFSKGVPEGGGIRIVVHN